MRWLVLGGTGLVGCYLVQFLAARGDTVDVVTRGKRRLPQGAGLVLADISRSDWIEQARLESYDVVCHLAYATTDDASYDQAVTVDSVLALLRHARQIDLKNFIYLGSMTVFGEKTPAGKLDETAPKLGETEYARNKIAATKAVMTAHGNFRASVLHPTGVYDPTSKRIKSYYAMLSVGFLDVPLTGVNNIVHAADVAAAVIQCADRRGGGEREEYIINGEAILYSDWIATLERHFGLTGKPRLPRMISRFFRGPLAVLARRLGWRRAMKVPQYKAALYRLQTRYSSDKALRDFDYSPSRFFVDQMKALA